MATVSPLPDSTTSRSSASRFATWATRGSTSGRARGTRLRSTTPRTALARGFAFTGRRTSSSTATRSFETRTRASTSSNRSLNGRAIGNVSYENAKGLRWGSESAHGLAIGNQLFDNLEAGISIKKATPTVLRGNRAVHNREEQLLVIQAEYSSNENCFETGSPDQLTVRFYPSRATEYHRTLAEYQKATGQDLQSRDGGCGPMPEKLNVRNCTPRPRPMPSVRGRSSTNLGPRDRTPVARAGLERGPPRPAPNLESSPSPPATARRELVYPTDCGARDRSLEWTQRAR